MTVQALLIAGPTASGKSGLAVRLAQKFGGAVINADSMQVYGDLRILSARPGKADMGGVPHLLFGHVDGAVTYSVGLWLQELEQALTETRARGLLPIIAGGTGLYFKALTQGLSAIPAVPPEIRSAVRALGERETPQALHERLMARDPVMASRLRPTDPQRILRALEVFEATGRSLAQFQGARTLPLLRDARGVFLVTDRAVLNGAINARFDSMLAAGALDEVRDLAARRLDPALPVMRACGVPALAAYLRSEIGLDEATERAKADSRAYAKRQLTFARHQLPVLQWLTLEQAEGELEGMIQT